MKFHELIKSNNRLSVELTLLDLYSDQENLLDEYRHVFETLKVLEPVGSEMEIVLTQYDDLDEEGENKAYVDVSGQDGIKDDFGITISYALEFTEWNKWLGMTISQATMENFSELEIIAHCLFEMTFIGFDEEEIQEEWKSLNKTIEDYENLTEEEKNQSTISLDELKASLDNDEDDIE